MRPTSIIIAALNFTLTNAFFLKGGKEQNKYLTKLQSESGFDFGTEDLGIVPELFVPEQKVSKSPSNELVRKSFSIPRFSFAGDRSYYPSSGRNSLNSTPRTSFIGRVTSIFRPSDESESLEMRPASTNLDRLDFSHIISFHDVDPIDWDKLSEPSIYKLSEEEEDIIDEYVYRMPVEHIGSQDFRTLVLKTLGHVCGTSINAFVVSLASELVYLYGNKAPNALKIFMERKMPFMLKGWDHSELNNRINSRIFGENESYKGLKDDDKFQRYVSTLFLDLGAKKGIFDALINLYMEAFDNITDSEEFIDRYSKILSALIEVAYQQKPKKNEKLNFLDIYNVLKGEEDMAIFSQKAIEKMK